MYSTWDMQQLKAELRKRGATLTGNKANLIERLESYDRNFNFVHVKAETESSIQIEIPSASSSRLESYDRNFNFGHVKAETKSSTEMEIPSAGFYQDVNATSVLPPITKHHIQDYFDRFQKSMVASKRLYEYRYLLNLRYCEVSEGYTFIKGFCKAKMKQFQYEVNIKLAEDGEPLQSQCDCAAGNGNEAPCKHVGIVLLGVANMSQEKFIILDVTNQQLQTLKYVATPLRAASLPSKRNVENLVFSPYPVDKIDKKSYNVQFRNKIINFQNSNMPLKQLFEPANPAAVENDHLYNTNDSINTILN